MRSMGTAKLLNVFRKIILINEYNMVNNIIVVRTYNVTDNVAIPLRGVIWYYLLKTYNKINNRKRCELCEA